MNLGIRARIVLIAVGAMLFAVGSVIIASGYIFEREYTSALQSRLLAIATSLKVQLERVLQFGLPVEELIGFDEQCQETVAAYAGIRYAMVLGPDGDVLFHSDNALRGQRVMNRDLVSAAKTGAQMVVPYTEREHEDYAALVPVNSTQGDHLAVVVVGFPVDLITTKVHRLMVFDIGIGLVFLIAGTLVLVGALSVLVTAPLTRLIDTVGVIRENTRDLSRRVTVNSKGDIGLLANTFNALMEELQRTTVSKAQLEHVASHDALTQLPNRTLLKDRLGQAIFQAERSETIVGVMFLDVDRFKMLNDTQGHAAGDTLLRELARRLESCSRKGDTVARFGGDEFVVVLTGMRSPDNVGQVVARIHSAISQPVTIGEQELAVHCSIGVSLYPQDGDNGELLLRNADTAMYQAKELGRNNRQFYTNELNARLVERATLQRELRDALAQEQFVLHYQPQVDLVSGHIVAMEALIRWQHPRLGLTPPGHFISAAEESGLIVPIGTWVLHEACRQAGEWERAGLPPIRIAVNLAAQQLADHNLGQTVVDALTRAGLTPQHLELELTETDVMRDPELMVSKLQQLRALGVSLAMDDFGTGYSSLSHLKKFAFDRLKIDRGFVSHITDSPEDLAITRTIMGIAQDLHMVVIAEGVETKPTLASLRRIGCPEVQGYLFSRPLRPEDATTLLRRNRQEPFQVGMPPQQWQTLLIVDDEANVINALKRALRDESYRVLGASSTSQAFDMLAMHEIQVIMCDQLMPGMSGIDFFSRVKEMYPETVRIMLTGYHDPTTIAAAINQGAIYKYLFKPLDDTALRHEIAGGFEQFSRQGTPLTDGKAERLCRRAEAWCSAKVE